MKTIGSSYHRGFQACILQLLVLSALILHACNNPADPPVKSNQDKPPGSQSDPGTGKTHQETPKAPHSPDSQSDPGIGKTALPPPRRDQVKYETLGDTSAYGTIEGSILRIKASAERIENGTMEPAKNGTERIIRGAFAGRGISRIDFPPASKLTHIGEFAFAGNNLTAVTIPDSVRRIARGAFIFNNLTQVTLSESLEIIEDLAFYDNNLQSAVIPKSVTRIEKAAFLANPRLKTVTISPELLRSIDYIQIFPAGAEFQDHSGNPIRVQ